MKMNPLIIIAIFIIVGILVGVYTLYTIRDKNIYIDNLEYTIKDFNKEKNILNREKKNLTSIIDDMLVELKSKDKVINKYKLDKALFKKNADKLKSDLVEIRRTNNANSSNENYHRKKSLERKEEIILQKEINKELAKAYKDIKKELDDYKSELIIPGVTKRQYGTSSKLKDSDIKTKATNKKTKTKTSKK